MAQEMAKNDQEACKDDDCDEATVADSEDEETEEEKPVGPSLDRKAWMRANETPEMMKARHKMIMSKIVTMDENQMGQLYSQLDNKGQEELEMIMSWHHIDTWIKWKSNPENNDKEDLLQQEDKNKL